MTKHQIVAREAWLKARQEHWIEEKEFTCLRDELSQERRDLPWVCVNQDYLFDGPEGQETLSNLFVGRSQFIVCKSLLERRCGSTLAWRHMAGRRDVGTEAGARREVRLSLALHSVA